MFAYCICTDAVHICTTETNKHIQIICNMYISLFLRVQVQLSQEKHSSSSRLQCTAVSKDVQRGNKFHFLNLSHSLIMKMQRYSNYQCLYSEVTHTHTYTPSQSFTTHEILGLHCGKKANLAYQGIVCTTIMI